MTNDKPLSKDAIEYSNKLFPCEKPCNSYGVCEGCYERSIFLSGYIFGYRAGFLKAIEILNTHEDFNAKILAKVLLSFKEEYSK